jgi:VanZ family protein
VIWKVTSVAWAGLIFYLSTAGFGSSFSEFLLAQALALLHVSVAPATFEVLHVLMRKSAHVTEYAILGMLLYGSQRDDHPFEWRPRRAVVCMAIAAAYSLTDEFHQSFVPGRTASLADCGIDTVGATLGVLAYYLRHWWHGIGGKLSIAN